MLFYRIAATIFFFAWLGCFSSCRAAHVPTLNLATPEAPARPQVVIIGGGLGGLVAAYELEKAGISIELLEASGRFGGRVATAYYENGLSAEYGLQEIWADNPLIDIVSELKLPLTDAPDSPWSSVQIDGRVHAFTHDSRDEYFRSFLTAHEFSQFEQWMSAASTLRSRALEFGTSDREVAALEAISFDEWLKNSKLSHRCHELLRLTIEVELGAPAASFSALFGLLEFGVFLNDTSAFEIVGGNTRLISALVKKVKGPKRLNVRATRVHRYTQLGETKVKVTYLDGDRFTSIDADHVIVAVPFFLVHAIQFDPPIDADRSRAIATLSRGHYVVAHLMMQKSARRLFSVNNQLPFPILTDGPLGVIYGIPNEPQSTGATDVFSLLIYGGEAAAFHMVPRENRIQNILHELEVLWPGVSQHVESTEIFTYHPGAIAVWPKNRSPIDALSQKIRTSLLNTHFVGDWLYNSHSDGAVRSAQNAANEIAGALRTQHR